MRDKKLASKLIHDGLFTMMTLLAIMGLLTGAVLGFRFKVSILVPAIAVGAAVTFVVGMANSDSPWLTMLAMALAVTSLQIGYLGGTAIRFIFKGPGLGIDSTGHIMVVQRPAA